MKPLIFAHRGASSEAPENTISAFVKAIECKSDYIELDVRKSKDGELVVVHDPNLKRLIKKKKIISKMTLEEIKEIELLDGERIPTLDEAIKIVGGRCRINTEIKTRRADREMIYRLINILRKNKATDKVMVSSFCHSFLKRLKKLEPRIETAALFVRKRDIHNYLRRKYFNRYVIRKAKKIEASFINMKYQFITEKMIKDIHEHHLKINAWTVDKYEKIRNLVRMGIDGIITNHPKKFQKAIKGNSR